MGQTISRHHTPLPTVPATSQDSSNSIEDGNTGASTSALSSDPTVLGVAPTSRPSRRSSVRKSILNLVRPFTRGHVDNSANNKHKSWRGSKRWSNVPPDPGETAESSSSQSAGPSTLPSSLVMEKEIEGEGDPDTCSAEQPVGVSDRPSTPFPQTLGDALSDVSEGEPQFDREVSQNIGSWLSAQGSRSQTTASRSLALPGSEDSEEVIISPDQFPGPLRDDSVPTAVETQSGAPPVTPTQLPGAPPTNGGRTFPPPGTLVVVQGVVHTTDVPRPSASTSNLEAPEPIRSSSTPPNPPSGARNRLSALLRSRPTSMIASRSHSIEPSNTSSTGMDTPSPDNLSSDTSIHSQSRSHSQAEITDTNASTEVPPPTEEDPRPGTISSSSIDVLGTLLSVAAAATAASLLTGSSEPILSSGLAPPVYNPNDTNPARNLSSTEPWASRPTSPTPTAGFGTGGDATAAGRAERLRHAWGGIRERLGLRPAGSENTNTNTDTPLAMPASNDPRELMLAQMARAFNLGFGLPGEGFDLPERSRSESAPPASASEDNATVEGATESQTTPDLPPEGSFERFLVDLQVDLRTTLTSSSGLAGNISNRATRVMEPEALISNPNSHVDPTTQVIPVADDDEDVSDSRSEVADTRNRAINEDHEEFSDLFDPGDPGSSRASTQGHSHLRVPHDNQQTGLPDSTDAIRDETANPPGPQNGLPGQINWWRLYRFPPIAVPRAQGAAAPGATRLPPSPPSSPPSSDTTTPIVMDPTLSELPSVHSEVDPQTQTQPNANTNTVIPVIVVGLQSVNTNWPRGQDDDNDGLDMFGEDGDTDSGDEDFNDDNTPNFTNNRSTPEGTGRNTATRGRAWRSRAAEAIRNLRPSRRNRAAPAVAIPGSRTFLIYVIGGYYPPNHSIVTGGPSNLDSFEALLELAELLGQVKPPTVSKEDIEKSGLEIIKPIQVEQYEKEGKISSNCTERCLICLDDYQPEEDVRVMTCRHAFHKICVDKWLETGRNNCPACRSKGVSLGIPVSHAEA